MDSTNQRSLYDLLCELLGDHWYDLGKLNLEHPEYVNPYFGPIADDFYPMRREAYEEILQTCEKIFELGQSYPDQYGGLPDPLVLFALDRSSKAVNVVSWEDWFTDGSHDPELIFRKVLKADGSLDSVLQEQLNLEFRNWLNFLLEKGFQARPVSARAEKEK